MKQGIRHIVMPLGIAKRRGREGEFTRESKSILFFFFPSACPNTLKKKNKSLFFLYAFFFLFLARTLARIPSSGYRCDSAITDNASWHLPHNGISLCLPLLAKGTAKPEVVVEHSSIRYHRENTCISVSGNCSWTVWQPWLGDFIAFESRESEWVAVLAYII